MVDPNGGLANMSQIWERDSLILYKSTPTIAFAPSRGCFLLVSGFFFNLVLCLIFLLSHVLLSLACM